MKTLLFGDVCPTKNVFSEFADKNTKGLFTDVSDFMSGHDFVSVNLECAITDTDEKIKKFGPNLKAPKATADILAELGVTLCGLSNNHVFDFGIDGARDTLAELKRVGIDYTGFGENYDDSRKNYYFEKNGEKIAVVAVCEHEYSYALDNRMGSRPFDEYHTMEDIVEAKKNADRVIVMYHGGKEYSKYPSPRLMRVCRAMVRFGADVVLCQHSHCIGCYENYMDSHILYGQGNFNFLGKDSKPEWYTSLAVEYDTLTNEITFTPIRSTETYISMAKDEDKENIIAEFEKRNEELQTGEWKRGWHEFCESMKARYYEAIEQAFNPEDDGKWYAYFGHMLDCEAHTDVWRELFPSWNFTNCVEK